jgi:hypothetical protein
MSSSFICGAPTPTPQLHTHHARNLHFRPQNKQIIISPSAAANETISSHNSSSGKLVSMRKRFWARRISALEFFQQTLCSGTNDRAIDMQIPCALCVRKLKLSRFLRVCCSGSVFRPTICTLETCNRRNFSARLAEPSV